MKKLTKQIAARSWRLVLAALSGLISGYALPRSGVWLAIFVSVAGILWVIRGRRFWPAFGLGQVAGLFFYASQSPWMTAYLGPVPWLALATLESLIFGLGMAVTAIIWNWLDRAIPKIKSVRPVLISLVLAASWVAREWVAGHFPYGGYQWSRLAQTQADTVLARLGFFGGLSLISFAVAFLAALLVTQVGRTRLMPSLSAGLAILLLATYAPIDTHEVKTVTIAGVQGNANAGLFSAAPAGSNLTKQIRESEKLVRDSEFSKVDFVIWPENASDLDPTRIESAKLAVTKIVNEVLDRPLLLGTVNWRGNDVYNTILQYQPGRGQVDYYDKQRPVPFAEYVPDRNFWNLLAPNLIGMITHGYSFGTKSGVFNINGVAAGSLICFEISIDDLTHKLIREGAQVIISQANNADFAKTDETFQQEALVRLQAISTGRSVAHISTVGVSETVWPDGTVHHRIAPFQPGHYISTLPLSNRLTPAEYFYGWVDLGCLLTTLIMLLIGIFSRKKAIA